MWKSHRCRRAAHAGSFSIDGGVGAIEWSDGGRGPNHQSEVVSMQREVDGCEKDALKTRMEWSNGFHHNGCIASHKLVTALETLTTAIAKSAIAGARTAISAEKPAQNSMIRCGWKCEDLDWNVREGTREEVKISIALYIAR